MTPEVNLTKLGDSSASFTIDGTAMMIYSYIIFTVLCQTLNLFGIVTNIINIVCFVKQGFKDTINVSLIGLSVSDLGSLITLEWTCITVTPAVIESDLPFEYMDLIFLVSGMPHFAFTRVSSCITAMITVERCLSIAIPLKVKDILTPKRATVATVFIFIIFTFSITPIYVVNRLDWAFSLLKNKTVLRLVSVEGRDNIEKITLSVNNFFIPMGAFVIVASCTLILSVQLHGNSKWRNLSVVKSQADKMSNRNKKVAKMVATISTMFIVCFLPSAIMMLAVAFEPELSVKGKFLNITILMAGFSYVVESINSSMNIVIYHSMSSKYRDTFRKLFGKGRVVNIVDSTNKSHHD